MAKDLLTIGCQLLAPRMRVFLLCAAMYGTGVAVLLGQSNVVQNGSFEGTPFDIRPWQTDTDYGHQVGYSTAAHGTNWIYYGGPPETQITILIPITATNQLGQVITNGWREEVENVYPSGNLWQDLETVPGRIYDFSFQSGGDGNQVRVHWGTTVVGEFGVTVAQGWFKTNFHVAASSFSTRIRVENLSGRASNLTVDDFRVVWMEEQPSITRQPIGRTGYEGQNAQLLVVGSGAPLLEYQWYFNQEPMDGETAPLLVMPEINSQDAGDYQVVVRNNYGSVTSLVARLRVEPLPSAPIITAQPISQSVPEGYMSSIHCAAIGEPPLSFQWFHNGEPVVGGNNPTLAFQPVGQNHAGTYALKVSNGHGTVTSLPAMVTVNPNVGGGYVMVRNRQLGTGISHPIYDVDGVTKLEGTNFLAQVYVGSSPEQMRPAGLPRAFFPNGSPELLKGIFYSDAAAVPDIPPNETVHVQLKVWDWYDGSTYEAARANGGKFGFSPVMQTVTYQIPSPPVELILPASFSLQHGLPLFTTGQLSIGGRLPGGGVDWELQGEAGFRYLVERRTPPHDWEPFLVVTNELGVVRFEDPLGSPGVVRFYRARMLD